jgi:prophage tail gpP-like protein
MIVMDMPGEDGKWAKQRAEWEKARRYGRSRQIQVTTTGWRTGTGQLWTPNTIVHVTSPTLKFDEDLLAYHVAWVRGPEGTQSQIQLMPRGGVLPEPFIPILPIPQEPVPAQ